jgi:hypothetical protein
MAQKARRLGRSNLPAELTSFVGRRQELREVKRLLTVTRLLTLTGSGGAGKTRLALHAAADMSRGFPDGAWLVTNIFNKLGLNSRIQLSRWVADATGRADHGRAAGRTA